MSHLRSIPYMLLMLICLALSAPGFALLHVSAWFAVLARRAWPTATWSNCWAWAAAEYWERNQAWQRAGMRKGREPYIAFRRSRHEPRSVRHTLVGTPRDSQSNLMDFESYVPTDPTEVPLILAWTHALFMGERKDGIARSTVPPDSHYPT